jgi:hypothetical protein
MTTSDQTLDAARSRHSRGKGRWLALAGGLALLGLWATAVVTDVGRAHGGHGPAGAIVPTPVATTTAAPAAFQAPDRRVVLPAGGAQVDEYPVSFPHTPEGAAAAAVALTRYSASLDYASASEVLRLHTTAGAAKAADSAAAAATSAARTRLGVAMTGPAPTDASVFAEPYAVHWVVAAPDKVRVSVLSSVEYRTGEKLTRELVAAASQWWWDAADADWRSR